MFPGISSYAPDVIASHVSPNGFVATYVKHHYNDVIMGAMVSQSPASPLFTQPFIQAQIKENIKAPRQWPLGEEFTGDRLIPRTKGQ